jgi:hypothetical protein
METNEKNLPDHWKVRVALRNAGLIHLASTTEPVVVRADGRVTDVRLTPLGDPTLADHAEFIDWNQVSAITWRFAPTPPPPEKTFVLEKARRARRIDSL